MREASSGETSRRNNLVAAARRGDKSAFERLFREMLPRIHNFIAHLVGDVAEAEDLTQMTFVRAWTQLPRLRSSEAFVVWLHRIARNLVRDRGRRRGTEVRETRDDEHATLAAEIADSSPGAQTERAVLDREADQAVRSAVAGLPEHQREAVVLHHLNGMPVEDVAATLGVATGTVLSRLARARVTIRRKLHWILNGEAS